MATEFVVASNIKPSHFVLLKGKPCKVVETSWSKTGKHGHGKIHFVGVNLFTGNKVMEIAGSGDKMEVPMVSKDDYQIVNVEERFLSLYGKNGVFQISIPEDMADDGVGIRQQLEEGIPLLATLQNVMGTLIWIFPAN